MGPAWPDRVIMKLFMLYVFLLPFENVLEVVWGIDTPYRPHRLLALACGFLVLISRPLNSIQVSKNDLRLVGMFLAGCIPTAVAWFENRLDSSAFLLTTYQLFVIFWVYFLIKNVADYKKQIHKMLNVFCTASAINGGYMIWLFLSQDIGRQSGFMDNPNYAAFTLVVSLSFFLLELTRSDKEIDLIQSVLKVAAIGISFAGIFVSGSRGGLVILVLAVVLLLATAGSLKKLFKGFGIAGLMILLISRTESGRQYWAVIPVLNRIEMLSNREEARTTLWKQGWVAFVDSGCMGLGIEQFKNPINYNRYVQTTQNPVVASQQGLVLHNDYLAVLYEYGPFAFLFYLAFCLWILRNLLSRPMTPAARVGLILFCCVLAFSLFATTFQSHAVWFVVLACSLLAQASWRSRRMPVQTSREIDTHQFGPGK
ncbi:MAG: O-antigen ligase family protein [Saprospiraceae bacterium]|nr:O-antigen ligase family protein [Saprospiraceae bacterium]